jgi:hypothetical protein
VASTWKPTYLWLRTSRHWTKPLLINAYVVEHRDGIVLVDTGQDRASVTDPGYFPGGATRILYDRLTRFDIAPAIRSPPGWRPSATTSPMCELRCCPISTRTTSAGCRSSNAARGTDLALGPSATLPRRGFRWPPAEQPAPPRASRRLHRGRA